MHPVAIDPILSLASSLHAGPGTYVLLLGSGVSASSGVLTGWQVAVDLARRVAILHDVDPGNDPLAWYRTHVGTDPDYSQLLDQLAPSQADRRNLLERYFEPTEEEREQGLKVPTKAHRAIAELVAKGYVRVIVLTNFDRLLEIALAEAGVQPHVVSSAAHAAGAKPLVHSRCTIIKVHGDYLSPDLKNTVGELASYDTAIDKLLEEVFDQYGIVVCGWSGVWDTALRNAMLRAPSRRYPTYWAHRGPLEAEATDVVAHRDAIVVTITDADSFFSTVAERVTVLSEAVDRRPETTEFAVAQLKRYLPNREHRIRLHDLVIDEVGVIPKIDGLSMHDNLTNHLYAERVKTYEQATATLCTLLTTGAFFGDEPEHDALWKRVIERLASRPVEHGGLTILLSLQQLPTTLAVYALGLGSIAARRPQPLAEVLGSVVIPDLNVESLPLGVGACSWTVLDNDWMKAAFNDLAPRTPISDHLHAVLRSASVHALPDDGSYNAAFDELEYVLGLAYADFRGEGIGPTGRFTWRNRSGNKLPSGAIDRHASVFTASGMFDGSSEKLAAVQAAYDKQSARQRH